MSTAAESSRDGGSVNKTKEIAGFGMVPRWIVFDDVHDYRQIALFAYMSSRRSHNGRVWVQLERMCSALLCSPNTARKMLAEACDGSQRPAWLERESNHRGDARGTRYRFKVGRSGHDSPQSAKQQVKSLREEVAHLRAQLEAERRAKNEGGLKRKNSIAQAQNLNPLLYLKTKRVKQTPLTPLVRGATRAEKRRLKFNIKQMPAELDCDVAVQRADTTCQPWQQWPQCIKKLRDLIGHEAVNSWFEGVAAHWQGKGRLKVVCVDRFQLQYIASNFCHEIETVAARLQGQQVKLSLIMASNADAVSIEISKAKARPVYVCHRCNSAVDPSTAVIVGEHDVDASLIDWLPSGFAHERVTLPTTLCKACAKPHELVQAEALAKGER